MSLHVEENYANGIPQTAVPGFAPRGLSWHWTAGGTGRAGALSTITHFVNTRYTVNASYHILLWFETATKRTYAMWIVPAGKASHSMNPAHAYIAKTGSSREKARFAEVRRILGAKAGDPNAGCISVSFCGMPGDLAAAVSDPVFRADVQELARQLIAHPAIIDRPHFGHGWIQPTTRYETDTATDSADMLIAPVLYGAVVAPPAEEKDMGVATRPVRQQWDIPDGMAFWTEGPSMGERKFFVGAQRLWSNGESLDGNWRRLEYEDTPGAGEELWAWRQNMVPVHGTRNPATGFGSPTIATETVEVVKEVIKEVPTGITEDDLEEAAEAERSRIAAAEAQRIREI